MRRISAVIVVPYYLTTIIQVRNGSSCYAYTDYFIASTRIGESEISLGCQIIIITCYCATIVDCGGDSEICGGR